MSDKLLQSPTSPNKSEFFLLTNNSNIDNNPQFGQPSSINNLSKELSLSQQCNSKSLEIFSQTFRKCKFKNKLIPAQLESLVGKIQTFIDDVDSKIQNRVQLVKQVYLNEFKQQVVDMSNQLKHLRQLLDGEVMKERANEKMFYLEQQRDFFRSEVLKLNQEMNRINLENKQLKKEIDQHKSQSENYKKIVYSNFLDYLDLQSKLMKIKSFNIKKEKMLANELRQQNFSKTQPLTKDTSSRKHSSLATDRQNMQKTQKQAENSLENRQFSRTGTKLRPSQSLKSYNKLSTPHKEFMRTSASINYPKRTTQKLEKIQGYSDILEKQEIVDECLKELKKQIYYRNLSIGGRDDKIHFNEASQVKFEKFTKTDKKQFIIRILSNQKFLNDFHQFLFDKHKEASGSSLINSSRLIDQKLKTAYKLKLTDTKFNTRMITDLKTQFNKKIYQIKHNR